MSFIDDKIKNPDQSLFFNKVQEDVKNTDEGIRAHLREIDRPEIRKYGKVSGHLFSSTGRKMPIYSLSIWRFIQMKIKNKRLIDKAYNSEAKRRGRFNVVLDGLLKRWTFKRVN